MRRSIKLQITDHQKSSRFNQKDPRCHRLHLRRLEIHDQQTDQECTQHISLERTLLTHFSREKERRIDDDARSTALSSSVTNGSLEDSRAEDQKDPVKRAGSRHKAPRGQCLRANHCCWRGRRTASGRRRSNKTPVPQLLEERNKIEGCNVRS